ncbi:RING-type domain-containing protein [Chloropicon primus]|uniref:RING-type domain-containing protein n=1 Tax=Chloropicon primus TaxID=1764295 RepID=A0A5B8MTY1_9CHLO|nr:hypothetical protein A3770_11p63250 [Chloropicon primus]UPR03020.1 RING-type domain-containing protein [Chloropicon primus]|mmetsp:Transcript_11477/g.31868  ORF Transcript_11477/g.31868 Transcript_11477/m.31868 type:complete len:471 (-) Transcript_11477:49-1461(-)|eukprot:QDZ23807.1 hypothetical protein A3770_11p63250 [Chloropicon primus]
MRCLVECSICMSGERKEWRTLEECGHTFCSKCLSQHFETERRSGKSKPSCPICRSKPAMEGIWELEELTFRTFLPTKVLLESPAKQGARETGEEERGQGRQESGALAEGNTQGLSPNNTEALLGGWPNVGGLEGALEATPRGKSSARRKTYAQWLSEVSTLEAEYEEQLKEAEEARRRLSAAKARQAKDKIEWSKAKRDLDAKLEAKERDVKQLQKNLRATQDRFRLEKERFQGLQLQMAHQNFFSDTTLDLGSIQKSLRGKDLASANKLLSASLATRNEEYNKLNGAYEEMREGKVEMEDKGKMDALLLENRKLKDRQRRLVGDIERLRGENSKMKQRQRPLPSREDPGKGGTKGASPDFKRRLLAGGLASDRGQGQGAPSFIDPSKQRSGGQDRGTLILDNPDGFGGKRKIPLRVVERNVKSRSLSLGASESRAKVIKVSKISVGREGEVVDPRRCSGLVMEHYFDRR